MKVIHIEFKRWTIVKTGTFNGQRYRISKYCPDGKFKEFTASVYNKDVDEWLPFKGREYNGGKVYDSYGHLDILNAI